MKKSEVRKLEDKDLQLRYLIGGLINTVNEDYCNYWKCDINCSCDIVPDDERLEAVKKFIKKHNITNERFIKLAYNFLVGAVMKYHDEYSQLFLELEEVLKPYQFNQSFRNEIPNNSLKEKELEKLVSSAHENDSIVGVFIKKYNLTAEDFIVLTKMTLNYRMHAMYVTDTHDTFFEEIQGIINRYDLSMPREYVQEYIKMSEEKQEATELYVETKFAQEKYLELMKKLLIKDADYATELIVDELSELGFTDKKSIRSLTRRKTQKSHL